MQSIQATVVFFVTLFFLVASSPVAKRQSDLATTEIQNIQTIGTDLAALNKTLNSFGKDDPLGLILALKVQLQTSQVSNDLVTAAKTANASAPFTSDESNQVASAVIALQPQIISTLNNIVTHKPSFATAVLFVGDLSQTVEQNLVQQRELSREFAAGLTAKLAEPYAGLSGLITGPIDDGKCSGAIQPASGC